ncbi:MAG: PH domain-containing protein [Halolamina sp.]
MSRRLSPLTVPYRAVERGGGVVFAALAASSSGLPREVPYVGGFEPRLLAAAGALLALVVLVAYEFARFRRFAYRVADDQLVIDSGVFARRSREVPLSRVQNVDVRQNAVHRVLGVAGVAIETAGGNATEASLQYVAESEADRLRDVVRDDRAVTNASEPTETELFALSQQELFVVGALSFDRRVPGLLAFLVSGSVPFAVGVGALPREALGLALLVAGVAVAAWVVGAAATVANYYGFRLTRSDSELRYERGLLRRYSGSIPLDKVQSVTVVDDPAKRTLGYATLVVETAGYGPSEGGDHGSMAAVPLADRDRVWSLARDVAPIGDVELDRPPERVRRRYAVRYLLALGAVAGLAGAAVNAVSAVPPVPLEPVAWLGALAALIVLIPPAAHLKWRHRGYDLGSDHVVTRNGVWKRRTKVVPYYRVQTVIDSRSPFQRRWNLGTVVVDTAGSRSVFREDAKAVDVDDEVATDLRETVHDRLQAALSTRRRSTVDRDDPARVTVDRRADGPNPGSGASGD